MNKKPNIIESFSHAVNGIKFAVLNNRNLRIHILVAALVIIASILLKISFFEASMVGLMILLVTTTEMINTVVEEIVNLIAKDYKIEAKIAKDASAGMVLLTTLAAAIVGIFIFLPHILNLLNFS